MLISVTLRIAGAKIDPEHISSVLKIQPIVARPTGEIRKLKSGKEITQRCGMWAWSTRDSLESSSLAEHIQYLAKALEHRVESIAKLPFVERAWLDVCVVESDPNRSNNGVIVNLDVESIQYLDKLGVQLEFTFYGSGGD
jgi:Domain of unknown function (DUF4279)